jgi:hypothetical protein
MDEAASPFRQLRTKPELHTKTEVLVCKAAVTCSLFV